MLHSEPLHPAGTVHCIALWEYVRPSSVYCHKYPAANSVKCHADGWADSIESADPSNASYSRCFWICGVVRVVVDRNFGRLEECAGFASWWEFLSTFQ